MATQTKKRLSRKPRARRNAPQPVPGRRGSRPRKSGVVKRGAKVLSGLISNLAPGASSEFREIEGTIARPQLVQLLSEFLSVEHGAILLYSEALDRFRDHPTHASIGLFLQQTRRQAELLEEALRELGGSVSELSPGAIVQQQRVDAWLHLEVTPEKREITDLENLVLAETKACLNWKLLRECVARVDDPFSRSLLQRMVDEVRDQKEQHLEWTRRTLCRLMLESSVQP